MKTWPPDLNWQVVLRRSAALGLSATISLVSVSGGSPPPPETSSRSAEPVAINDNRRAAGTMAGDALTIRLEARSGQWHPDGDARPGIIVNAFGVEGGPLQIPAPLIRVTAGTEIRAIVRNRLDGQALAVHGMYTRPSPTTELPPAVIVPAGETHEFRFLAGQPGTYYYWAATAADTPLGQRTGSDSPLSGAFIVDPRGSQPSPDRVLLIGSWGNGVPLGSPGRAFRFVINGRSWPHTERLTYRVGDTVRMRLINAGGAVHPMHLHGFYFNVDSRGNEREDTVFPPSGSPHLAVTERLPTTQTFSLTWTPTRPGNWLFHCHDNAHLERVGELDGRPLPSDPHRHIENHALEMMAGPVMGITVTGESTELRTVSSPRRQLRLVARVDTGGTADEPAFGYTLDSGSATTTPPPPYLPGPMILLKRGEPVTITVANELPEPTAVHWHGIELESYFDGVAGFAGDGKRIAPAIPPGGTFEARFTPPRSGTFIYHTHIDEVRQQQAGLAGPLLVVDSPDTYDPEHDIVVMLTVPRKQADADVVLLNGSSTPALREMHAGRHYRLRFINLHTFRPNMRMRLLRDSTLLSWRAVAKDGRDLPADQAIAAPSEVQMGNGETYDFDFVPSGSGDIRLDVTTGGYVLLVSMPIRIR